MQFLMMSSNDQTIPTSPPTPEMFVEMDKLIQEMSKAGVLLATGGLDPHFTHVQSVAGQVTITDGPFTEAKEAVVGFVLIDVKSKQEAIEYSKKFWDVVGDGQGKIYQVFTPEDAPPGV